MNIKINNKNHELNFGIKAIEKIDKMYSLEAQGFELGAGLIYMQSLIAMQNPLVLVDLLKVGLEPQISNKELDAYIESLTDEELYRLYDDVVGNFMNARLVKLMMLRLEKM